MSLEALRNVSLKQGLRIYAIILKYSVSYGKLRPDKTTKNMIYDIIFLLLQNQ